VRFWTDQRYLGALAGDSYSVKRALGYEAHEAFYEMRSCVTGSVLLQISRGPSTAMKWVSRLTICPVASGKRR